MPCKGSRTCLPRLHLKARGKPDLLGPVLVVTTSYLQGKYGVEMNLWTKTILTRGSEFLSWLGWVGHGLEQQGARRQRAGKNLHWKRMYVFASRSKPKAKPQWRTRRIIFGTIVSNLNIGLMKSGWVQWQEAEETRKNSILYRSIETRKFFTSELFRVISGRNPINPSLQDNVLIPDNFFVYIYYVGCAINLHSITNSGLIPGRQILGRERQTVFFTAVNPMDKEHKDPYNLDLIQPRLAWYKQKTWKGHQDTFWVDIQLSQRKGLTFHQTRWNALILCDTLPVYCIPKAVVILGLL